MIALYVTLQTLGVDLTHKLRDRLATDEDERGAHVIEYLVIAVGVLAIAGLVVFALRGWVSTQLSHFNGGN